MNDYEKYLREESPTFMGEPSVKKQRNYPNAADYAEATEGVDMAELQRKILAAAPTTDAPTMIDPAELASLRRDAARYRFIRSGECHVHAIWFQSFGERFNLMESDLDDSVDAALAANGEKGT